MVVYKSDEDEISFINISKIKMELPLLYVLYVTLQNAYRHLI